MPDSESKVVLCKNARTKSEHLVKELRKLGLEISIEAVATDSDEMWKFRAKSACKKVVVLVTYRETKVVWMHPIIDGETLDRLSITTWPSAITSISGCIKRRLNIQENQTQKKRKHKSA